MAKKLQIEIVSDYVCPWCYVGKRRLEQAIAQRPGMEFEVRWQPFQLSPDMPREGRDRVDYYASIFGEERAQQIMASMADTGKEEGIAFATLPGAKSPNTLAAHTLMLWASDSEDVDTARLAEKLFHAHHVECADIGDVDVLADIAGQVGMDAADVRTRLTAREDEDRVAGVIGTSIARGVSGVPFFIINGRYGISGAQPADTLAAAFDQVSAQS